MALVALPHRLAPAVIVVDGTCSLADAITAANNDAETGGCPPGSGADEIVLTSDVLLTERVDGDNGLPVVTSLITIQGNDFTIARDTAAPSFRLFSVVGDGQADLTLEDLTLTQGELPVGAGGAVFVDLDDHLVLTNVTVSGNTAHRGGGIYADYRSYVAIYDSRISDNAAERGGGIYSDGGNVALSNSTVSGNAATVSGGGLQNKDGYYSGYLRLNESTVSGNTAGYGAGIASIGGHDFTAIYNSTISGNDAVGSGGGVFSGGYYNFLILVNTTITNNSTVTGSAGGVRFIDYGGNGFTRAYDTVVTQNVGGNCFSDDLRDEGGNLDDDGTCGADWGLMAGLDPELKLNGGLTETHALLDGSSAIDAGVACREEVDQRGYARNLGPCDSGAFELGAGVLSLTGECPGVMTVAATDSTPETLIELFEGPDEGSSEVRGGPCVGTTLQITDPQRVAFLSTDENGDGSVGLNLTQADCGQFLQGVVEADCTVTNVLSLDSCSLLTLNHTGNGDDPVASPPNSPGCPVERYVPGDVVTVTAAPDPNWAVGSWTGTDDDSSSEEMNTVTMPGHDHTVTVSYIELCHELSLTTTGEGEIPEASPPNSPGCTTNFYLPEEIIDLSGAVPAPGWAVGGWTGTDDDVSTDSTNTVTMPAADHTVAVNYVQFCFGLLLTHTGFGSDPVAFPSSSDGCPEAGYLAGEVVELTVSPDPGWEVGGWNGTDDDASTSTMNTVTMPAADHAAGVEYLEICFPLALERTGSGTDPVAVPLSDGTSWNEHVVDGAFDGASSVHAADMDGDADLDILGAASNADDVTWWENTQGDGSVWADHPIASSFNGAWSVYAADLDGDGDMDVLGGANFTDEVIWWENAGGDGTTWTEHVVGSINGGATSVQAADMDGDADPDILVAQDSFSTGDVTWWENTLGDGTEWIKHTVGDDFGEPRQVDAADMDGDGDVDLLVAEFDDDEITWWENESGDGTSWTKHVVDRPFLGAISVHAVDVDGDTDLDVLGGAGPADGIAWWENTAGDGTSWTKHAVPGGIQQALSVLGADVDGDGDIDVLAATDPSDAADGIRWWENTEGDGSSWNEHAVASSFGGTVSVLAVDVDGDADLDVLGAASRADDITWWENFYGGTCPAGSFNFGDRLALTATPDPGWEVAGWSGTDDDTSTESTNTATMPESSHTVSTHYVESSPSSLSLSIGGACPGGITLHVSTSATNQDVQIYAGPGAGASTIPGGACSGTELDIDLAQHWRSLATDESGRAVLHGHMGTPWCGRHLQAIDRNCATSNVVEVPTDPPGSR